MQAIPFFFELRGMYRIWPSMDVQENPTLNGHKLRNLRDEKVKSCVRERDI